MKDDVAISTYRLSFPQHQHVILKEHSDWRIRPPPVILSPSLDKGRENLLPFPLPFTPYLYPTQSRSKLPYDEGPDEVGNEAIGTINEKRGEFILPEG